MKPNPRSLTSFLIVPVATCVLLVGRLCAALRLLL
jgi:hypothetical protein